MTTKKPTDFQRSVQLAAVYASWVTGTLLDVRDLYDRADYSAVLKKLKDCKNETARLERQCRTCTTWLDSELTPEIKLQRKREEAEAQIARGQKLLEACEEGETE